ncbi:hypothetical protein A3G55_00255 [Candidatus Giovannonibacteria bacterium RIFCSPLOWO2_12_FULL_44_25]|nr:MAG: hypothetical protein A2656_04310 [Candidatus Giovannonibacteria bacterium RIFCSPHIGHO2_01_FULL_44_100]OGF93155.1 MAG: hypothetical protein A3G55_00255 [Candidatus Giovannonibacteria bacterium RIFCSPLOWO2_12_FULL_44_25]
MATNSRIGSKLKRHPSLRLIEIPGTACAWTWAKGGICAFLWLERSREAQDASFLLVGFVG